MKSERSNKALENYIRELLFTGVINTQQALCKHLEQQGYDINQSKVSRLLRKIGAVKVKNKQGDLVYALAKEPDPLAQLSELGSIITNITHNETLIVIHTMPGAANYVARSLDYERELLSILGTIAGDDTIAVIPKQTHQLEATLNNIKQFFDK